MEKPNLDKFFGVPGTLNAALLMEQLAQIVFLLADTEISPRLIQNRRKEGLLLTTGLDKSVFPNLSFVQYIWLKMIAELRAMGTPLKLIESLKEGISYVITYKWLYQHYKLDRSVVSNLPDDDPGKKQINELLDSVDYESEIEDDIDEDEFTILHFLIIETITSRKPLSILLFKDGYWLPWSETGDYAQFYGEEEHRRKTFETHATVSISNIVKDFLASDKLAYAIPKLNILNENELKILELIGSGDYKSVTINFKNKKMKSLELIKEQSVKRKVVDILSDNGYQDIVIKSHKGIVTHIQNTVKVIFDR